MLALVQQKVKRDAEITANRLTLSLLRIDHKGTLLILYKTQTSSIQDISVKNTLCLIMSKHDVHHILHTRF